MFDYPFFKFCFCDKSYGIAYDTCNSRILVLTHTTTDNLIWVFDTNFNSIGNISSTTSTASSIIPSGLTYLKIKYMLEVIMVTHKFLVTPV